MKIIGLLVALLLVFGVLGCRSTPPAAPAAAVEAEVEAAVDLDADDEYPEDDVAGDE